MRKVLTVISKTIAVLFAVLFVLAAVLLLTLVTLRRTLLDAETYKRALAENNFYEQLPLLVSEQFSALDTFLADPCAENPLGCVIDGAPPELQTCLTEALGEKAYVEVGSGRRNPTEAEMQRSQGCLDRFAKATPQTGPGVESPGENPLPNASADVQACAREALGDETYETLYNAERPPTKPETRRINTCIRQIRNASESNNSLRDDGMLLFSNFSPEQYQELIVLLLPTDELQQMTESALDEVFSYLNGEADTAKVSLVNLKARLTGQAGEDLIRLLLDAQPPCTEEQRAQIDAGDFENGGQQAVYCAASGETLALMLPEMQDRLEKVVSTIPDEATLIKPASASARTGSEGPLGNDPVTVLRNIDRLLSISPLLLLSLLLLVTLFGVRSRKGWLRWWGIPLFITGLLGLAEGIAAQPLLDWAWANHAAERIPPMFSASLGELGHDLLFSIVHELAKWIMIEASLIALLGLATITGASFVRPKPKPKLEESARAFTAPELSRQVESDELIPSRSENESGYS